MTDKQKLQQLFDAALKDPTEITAAPPKRAFPTPVLEPMAVPAAQQPVISSPPAAAAMPEAAIPAAMESAGPPTMSAVLDDAASAELAALLDEQMKRKARKRRMEALTTALVLLGLTGGGSAWFVQDPARIQAFKEAMRDIRSVGDVKSLVAKYQDALNRVSARSQQIDQATNAMGVVRTAKDEEDPYFDAEMKQMMGGQGKTVGDRNRAMKDNFGHMEKKEGVSIKATLALKQEESFEWK